MSNQKGQSIYTGRLADIPYILMTHIRLQLYVQIQKERFYKYTNYW